MRRRALGAALLVAVAAGLTFTAVPVQGRQQPGAGDSETAERAADDVQREVRRLRRTFEFGGGGPEIGVSIRDVEAGSPGSVGAQVERVREDSPAEKAGIRAGDVITQFDGERVRSARQLSRLVSETPAGRSVALTLSRDGQPVQVQVTPEAAPMISGTFEPPQVRLERMPHFRFEHPEVFEQFLPGDGDRVWSWSEGVGPGGRGRLGIGVQRLTPQLAEYFGTNAGVLVTTVRENSPAATAGLKAGDVITAVNGSAVASPADLTRAVRDKDGADVRISYTRDRKSADVQVTLPSREEQRKRERAKRPARPA